VDHEFLKVLSLNRGLMSHEAHIHFPIVHKDLTHHRSFFFRNDLIAFLIPQVSLYVITDEWVSRAPHESYADRKSAWKMLAYHWHVNRPSSPGICVSVSIGIIRHFRGKSLKKKQKKQEYLNIRLLNHDDGLQIFNIWGRWNRGLSRGALEVMAKSPRAESYGVFVDEAAQRLLECVADRMYKIADVVAVALFEIAA